VKVHFEATLSAYHEGCEVMEPDEAAEFAALTTDEERHKWLRKFVHDLVYDGDHEVHREVEDGAFWYVEDDDGERHFPAAGPAAGTEETPSDG
jgi:hypothetical protein